MNFFGTRTRDSGRPGPFGRRHPLHRTDAELDDRQNARSIARTSKNHARIPHFDGTNVSSPARPSDLEETFNSTFFYDFDLFSIEPSSRLR
ncbi:hypothetical protein GE061_003010 [Apolygus lucorum]|uniref:Uncharacterized protein n=1 Tax=Apolygus lucorum TaxID=248454 RepID=A0A6A4JMH1_APOLU|nr:hypothetical protein GE061_003010 [Apolygus lucorum]